MGTSIVWVLSAIAGAVDVIGFLSFGIFTAHITGNVVLMAALIARGGALDMAQIAAIPVFILAVAATSIVANISNRQGAPLERVLLMVHFCLLCCVLTVSVFIHAGTAKHGFPRATGAMLAVCAMGCQFALLRLAVPGVPSTAVMTGNLATMTLAATELVFSGDPARTALAKQKFIASTRLLTGFFVGCLSGAAALYAMGDWAWALPAGLAGVTGVPRRFAR
jgi:uncharacterized membrane protein YoaK (UPF0700 family)